MANEKTLAAFCAAACLSSAAFQSDGQVLSEDRKLLPPGITAMDQFGHNVAIEGDVVVVGALLGSVAGEGSGAAFVFDASTGSLLDRLVGNDTDEGDLFSDGLSISNGLIYAGAPRNDTNGLFSGRTYVFDSASALQIDRFDPVRIVFVGEDPVGAGFGWSVDAGDGFVVVGSPGDVEGANGGGGAVYIYNESDRSPVGKFFANDPGFADNYGRRVATASGRVIVSSPFDDDNGADSGSVYVLDASTGQQIMKIVPSNGAPFDLFGLSLAADGDLVVVGAPFASINGESSGAVYLFDLNTGRQIGTLSTEAITAGDRFGRSVAIDGGLIVVGAGFADPQGDASGAAYVFDRETRQQIATLLPSDGQAGDVFGNAVAISGNRVLVGAEGDDDAGDFAGSAYLFTIDNASCAVDLAEPFGSLNFFDLAAFIGLFNAGDPGADFAAPFGSLNFFDVAEYIVRFNAGCP